MKLTNKRLGRFEAMVTTVDSQLSYGDKYIGPLSEQRKDSIILVERISIEHMKHRNYE